MCGGVNLVCICFCLRKISLNLPPSDHIWMQITGEGIEGILVNHLGSGLSPEWLLSNWAPTESISITLSNYWFFKRFVPQSLYSSCIEMPLVLSTLFLLGLGVFVCLFCCFVLSFISWHIYFYQVIIHGSKGNLRRIDDTVNKCLGKFLSSSTNLTDLI